MGHVIDMSQESKAWQADSRVKATVAMVIVAGLVRIPLIALGVVLAWAWVVVRVRTAVPVWAWVAVRVKAMDPAWAWDAVHVRAAAQAWVIADMVGMDRVMVADRCMVLAVIPRRNNASATLVKRFL